MKKKSIVALACAAVFSLTASADSSYTYTAGDTSLGDGAVTITYENETTDIATLIANPVNNETITLTGSPATFADGATITLSSSGTVSFAKQVTTRGALTLARSDGAYIVWTGNALTNINKKTGNYATAFDSGNIVAADLEPTSVVYVATGSECPGRFDKYVSGPSSSIFIINRVNADHSYTIRPQIGTSGLRCITASRSPRFGYYPNRNLWANNSIQGLDKGHWCAKETAISDGGDRLGVPTALGLTKIFAAKKGMAALANVRFDGGVVLGGETSVAAGMEAVLAVMEEGDNVISGTFTGDGDVRIVPMAPTAYTASHYFGPWISTSWKVVATNRSLSALTTLAGKMQGKSHSPGNTEGGSACNAYHINYDPATDTATCQFQLKSSTNNKVVFARLQQNGANVEIQAIKAGNVNVNTYPVGTDLTDVTLNGVDVATSTNTGGYGIHMITATFEGESKMGCVTWNGTLNAMVGNRLIFEGNEQPLYVTVASKTAFPSYGDVNVGSNATVALKVSGLTVSDGVSGGTSTLNVLRGGVLSRHDNGQIGKKQQVVVDGGTLVHSTGGGVYFHYLLMKDGARMTSSGAAPRSAWDNPFSYYSVVGAEPSSIEGLGIRPYGNKTDSTSRTFQINVDNVTGDDGIDCTLSSIQSSDYPYYHFAKWGSGTLKLEGDGKAVRLESTLYGGTFLLGTSNSMTNAVVLAGGSFAVDGGTTNALGALTVSNACTIAVGEGGALSFTSFTASEELQPKAITVDAPFTGDVLKIGSTLTSEEYRYFRWKDPVDETKLWKVKQAANGYLHPLQGMAITIL